MSRLELEKAEIDARRELLPRHCAGDAQAFAEFMDLYRNQIYSFIVRSGVDAASRDDLFQEIFIKVHTSAPKYFSAKPVEPWLFTIAANTVRSHFRKVRVRAIVQSRDELPEQVSQSDASDLNDAAETARWLEQEIAKLPDSQREAVVLCCVKDLSQLEVSQIMGVPVNTLKTHISRARASLAKQLSRRNAVIKREAL